MLRVVGSFFAAGTEIPAARAIGEGDATRRDAFFRTGFNASVLVSLLVTFLALAFRVPLSAYLCADEAIRPYVTQYVTITMIGALPVIVIYTVLVSATGWENREVTVMMVGMATINIVPDVLFVEYMNMELFGAGLASTIATSVACAYGLIRLLAKDSAYTWRAELVHSWADWRTIGSAGFPSSFNFFCSNVRLLIVNAMLLAHGGGSLVAVFSVINGIWGFGECVTIGVPSAGRRSSEMKGKWLLILPVMICAVLLVCASAALAEEAAPEDEWTVLFYMCGSDLESKYSYASGNLEEISKCEYPHSRIRDMMKSYEELKERAEMTNQGHINVLIETGGCKQWHAQKLGLDISNTSLQRWRYEGYMKDDRPNGFYLEQTLPLQSMADPETLTDFVRWGAENYPAKKYALVLWDHGGGSKTGIFIDELFDGDYMNLRELGSALRSSGVHLEAVLFDACLMAGIETVSAIADSVNWMIASEEVVAGEGSAVDDWLQQLYITPEFNGERLGRWVCDMSQIKYTDEGDEEAQQLLTWSVIDLSKIPQLVQMVDFGFEGMGKAYAKYPKLMSQFSKYLMDIEQFGTSEDEEGMFDLSGLLYAPEIAMVIQPKILRNTLQAMKEAVVYSTRGPGRSAARGISFCYAVDFDLEELEGYARNCPMPHYLAFLDAISPWTAPDWVYETCEHLPEMSEIDAYRVKVERVKREDGTPALTFSGDYGIGAGLVRYRMFKEDEESGQMLAMGIMPTYFDASVGENGVYTAIEPWLWPALEGQPVASYVQNMVEPGSINYLGSIPVQIGTEQWFLRYGYFGAEDRYTVYGLWEGYDTDSVQFNRNVKSLSQLVGQEYSGLYISDEKLTQWYLEGLEVERDGFLS